jgi:hypothetical protein
MILSASPYFGYQDTIDDDGKSHSIDVTCEFVGLYSEDSAIHILLLEKDSTYHEDTVEEVASEMFKRVLKPIERAGLDLHGIKLTIDACIDTIPSWGDISYGEIQYD